MGKTVNQAPLGADSLTALEPATFGNVLCPATWLMSMSPAYKGLPIEAIEARTLPVILLKQFKLYFKGNQPVAFVACAMLSGQAKAGKDLAQKRRCAGPRSVVGDVI